MPKVTLVDNYDSFTWNLVHALGALGAEVDVHRNDAITVDEIAARVGTISYEILTGLTPRLPREYLSGRDLPDRLG